MIKIVIVALVVMAAVGTEAPPPPPPGSPRPGPPPPPPSVPDMGDCTMKQAEALQQKLKGFLQSFLAQNPDPKAATGLVLAQCDANKDSSLDAGEFTACLKAYSGDSTISNDCYRVFLGLINLNGDGVIDQKELAPLFGMVPPPKPSGR